MAQTIPVMTLGWIGMITNVIGYGLQTSKTLKKKQVKSLSVKSFMQNFLGGMLWLWNSILTDTLQGSVAGVLMLSAQAILFYFFAKEKGKSKITSFSIMGGLFAMAWGSFIISVLIQANIMDEFNISQATRISVGACAAVVASTAFIPQFIKMTRDKDVKDLAWGLLILSSVSQSVWIIFWGMRMSESIDMWISGFAAGIMTGTLFYLLLFTKISITRKMKLEDVGNPDFTEIH